MADEVKLFGRLSLYALVVGTIYWFVSYEFVGTVMLLGFGLATGLAFIILFRRDRKVRAARAADGPGTADAEPVPVPGLTGRSATSRGRYPRAARRPLSSGSGSR